MHNAEKISYTALCAILALAGYYEAEDYVADKDKSVFLNEDVEVIRRKIESHECRLRFCSKLAAFSVILSSESTSDKRDFLSIECACSELRTAMQEYSLTLSSQWMDLTQCWIALTRVAAASSPNSKGVGQTILIHAAVLGRTLVLQLRRQLELEQTSLSNVCSLLDSLYCFEGEAASTTFNNQAALLQKWEASVRQRKQLSNRTWKNAKKFSQRLLSEKDVVKAKRSSRRKHKASSDISHSSEGEHQSIKTNVNEALVESDIANTDETKEDQPEGKVPLLCDHILASTTIHRAVEAFMEGVNNKDEANLFHTVQHCNNEGNKPTGQFFDSAQVKESTIFLLLTGPHGSGKSYICDCIQRNAAAQKPGGGKSAMNDTEKRFNATAQISVIRPILPVDLLGKSAGSLENNLIALFAFAKQSASTCFNRKCILLLDGLDHILGDAYCHLSSTESNSESYMILKTRTTFLNLIDNLRRTDPNSHKILRPNECPLTQEGDLLVVCTARVAGDEISERFDKVFNLDLPTGEERHAIITSCLSPTLSNISSFPPRASCEDSEESVAALMSNVVGCTVGRTVGEVTKYCRAALTASHTSCVPGVAASRESVLKHRLNLMKQSLQTILPLSVSGGALDGVVDMKVTTSRELQFYLCHDHEGNIKFPLVGASAEVAWKQFQTLIVTPLCRSSALDELLFCHTADELAAVGLTGKKSVCSGALLTGVPGCGKTLIAHYCAAVASNIDPSIRLIEISCTSLVHKEVGGSERAVQKLFAAARAASPCIVLLDGIEIIAPVRGNSNTTEGTMDRLLSTVLTEMDGMSYESSNVGNGRIAVIGITHNPNWVDSALCRPGRLEKTIRLDNLDTNERQTLLFNELERRVIDFSDATTYFAPKTKGELAYAIAMQTSGLSAAELLAICHDASRLCLGETIDDGYWDKLSDSDDCQYRVPILCHGHYLAALELRKVRI